MNEAIKNTVFEWACNCGIKISDDQVQDLILAIDACNDMESMPFMFQGK